MGNVNINIEKDKKGIPSKLTGTISAEPRLFAAGTPQKIALVPASSADPTDDQAVWGAIRNRANAANFTNFEKFIDVIFCHAPVRNSELEATRSKLNPAAPRAAAQPCYHGLEAYNLLKAAAEVFLALQCGIKVKPPFKDDGTPGDPEARIPGEAGRGSTAETFDELANALANFLSGGSRLYLHTILNALKFNKAASPLCEGILRPTLPFTLPSDCYPCMLELIWSYWHEEGMLVQSLNALCLRFQNKRGPRTRDPLANLRLDPLRPLNTLLWGYIQDEINRLTVARRAYEYDHEYGLRLVGKAVADLQPVDSRSKFLEAFHNLLYVTSRFYKEADDTTVRADAFPVLNALKELHLILAQGAHNQFGDLPWTARVEMLIQKWLLARPEIREFLGGAPMVPYKESWMAHADSMKTLQGWTDVSVSHFRDLGVFGEQILLSVRHADWNSDDVTQANANNWAIYWRPEIQSYIHSYRAVTGVDLSSEVTDTRSAAARYVQPAIHQMRRLNLQRNGGNGLIAARNGNGSVYSR
ncbi:MAG TPA: hypothetical protein VEL06_06470 [Haliangiales bacterium]|nr:hypothetical protein [Haliangiales bacterium]